MSYNDEYSCGGRPSLFNEERAERVLEGLRKGLNLKQAAAYGAISYSTLNRWRQNGLNDEEGEFWEFWKAVEEAQGEFAARMIERVTTAADDGDWKAATFILERRFPNEWGRNATASLDPTEPLFPI